MKRIPAIILLSLFYFLSPTWAADVYQAKVVGVSNGDTIKVLHNGEQIRIRLYGIDTPEKKQAFGQRTKQFTADNVAGRTVMITTMDIDRYGRTVALVRPVGADTTLNEVLVRLGYAWVYRKYCKADFCADWITYEQAAQSSGRGLWSDKDPIPPWEFRRK